jgi:DNA-directed RNA polymerase specialized sigma24 family protein
MTILDERGVTDLYAEQSERIRRIIAAQLKPADKHVADDLAQEVWLGFWRTQVRGTDVTCPAALLATMARRRVVDHYRLARVRREVCTEDMAVYADGGTR